MTTRTRFSDLPELCRDAVLTHLDDGPFADESDYAEAYADAALLEAAAQQRESAANESDHAPTDAELAGDESISAFYDALSEGFAAWLSAQVELPEHFTIAQVAA